ncbi:stress responsive protein [Coraliomargarita sinensis]|uniref:Stress responsive protein n=1 Tax=Coraliomargarita sinensis TaxID=2174842 RepID=A0A317ZMA8_9BACT|nr:Dabb family protein [Coraliomargarita sinensis]PXA05068.1 stress responsive protein [Coraliomargarita sinensis]
MKQFLLSALLFAFIFPASGYADPAESNEFDPTFTHVVYFWLKNPKSESDRAKFEAAVKQFMQDSKYAKTRFVGIAPKATRDVVDDSFTYSLILSFESAEAQEKYQTESAHVVFVEACKDLWEKVIVYDSVPLPKTGV